MAKVKTSPAVAEQAECHDKETDLGHIIPSA